MQLLLIGIDVEGLGSDGSRSLPALRVQRLGSGRHHDSSKNSSKGDLALYHNTGNAKDSVVEVLTF